MKFASIFHVLKISLIYIISLLLILAYTYLIVWTYCYSLYVCYLLVSAFAACFIIFYFNRNKKQAIKFLLLGLLLFLILSPFNIKQYNQRAASFQERIQKKGNLTNKEKLGVYGCLVMVTIFDFIPFPEASVQNFYLFFPTTTHYRVFKSNSILNSPSILKAIKENEKGYISWNRWENQFNNDFRYAIAFNLSKVRSVDKGGIKEITLLTNVNYRENHVTVHATNILHGLFSFRIDEGLFFYLQEKGWLHPYTAIWKANLKK